MLNRVIKRSLLLVLVLILTGCLEEPEAKERYISLEPHHREQLPLAPHVIKKQGLPNQTMIKESQGIDLRFKLLDKRTLVITKIEVPVGGVWQGPWKGTMEPVAFIPDLVIQSGQAMRGEEGHVNPAVWVRVSDNDGDMIHEGWFFVRDHAQTAWDHHRFDLMFMGIQPKNHNVNASAS
ncbi:MAG: hypothetical protein HQL54_11540 [Magnetococcales bacterium]|nr:hypothetical protein [Magnetococcales bacterium]